MNDYSVIMNETFFDNKKHLNQSSFPFFMSELRAKKKEYTVVEFGDLERFISQEYGHLFEFAVDQESGNDTYYAFSVERELDDYERKYIQEFEKTGTGVYLARALLNDLCIKGKIEPGEYLIRVSW